jgi:predicted anti-sigma-YlaC factor YlaD
MNGWRMRREHRWARRHLSDMVDGELPRRRARRLRDHLAICPECGPMLRELLGVRGLLLAAERPRSASGSVVPTVLARLRAEPDCHHDHHRH